jgi:hypothetical protein
MRESQVEKLEEKIEQSLRILEPYLPKKGKNSETPYRNIQYLEGSACRLNGNKRGSYHMIMMEYNEAAFKEAPDISHFRTALIGYYQIVMEKPKISTRENKASEGMIIINIPKHNPRITAILDTGKKHMRFGYKKGDEKAQIMISAYIKKLVRS